MKTKQIFMIFILALFLISIFSISVMSAEEVKKTEEDKHYGISCHGMGENLFGALTCSGKVDPAACDLYNLATDPKGTLTTEAIRQADKELDGAASKAMETYENGKFAIQIAGFIANPSLIPTALTQEIKSQIKSKALSAVISGAGEAGPLVNVLLRSCDIGAIKTPPKEKIDVDEKGNTIIPEGTEFDLTKGSNEEKEQTREALGQIFYGKDYKGLVKEGKVKSIQETFGESKITKLKEEGLFEIKIADTDKNFFKDDKSKNNIGGLEKNDIIKFKAVKGEFEVVDVKGTKKEAGTLIINGIESKVEAKSGVTYNKKEDVETLNIGKAISFKDGETSLQSSEGTEITYKKTEKTKKLAAKEATSFEAAGIESENAKGLVYEKTEEGTTLKVDHGNTVIGEKEFDGPSTFNLDKDNFLFSATFRKGMTYKHDKDSLPYTVKQDTEIGFLRKGEPLMPVAGCQITESYDGKVYINAFDKELKLHYTSYKDEEKILIPIDAAKRTSANVKQILADGVGVLSVSSSDEVIIKDGGFKISQPISEVVKRSAAALGMSNEELEKATRSSVNEKWKAEKAQFLKDAQKRYGEHKDKEIYEKEVKEGFAKLEAARLVLMGKADEGFYSSKLEKEKDYMKRKGITEETAAYRRYGGDLKKAKIALEKAVEKKKDFFTKTDVKTVSIEVKMPVTRDVAREKNGVPPLKEDIKPVCVLFDPGREVGHRFKVLNSPGGKDTGERVFKGEYEIIEISEDRKYAKIKYDKKDGWVYVGGPSSEIVKGFTLTQIRAAAKEKEVEVKKGETIWGIVKKEYGLTDNAKIQEMVNKVLKLNEIKKDQKIQPGQKLVLPKVTITRNFECNGGSCNQDQVNQILRQKTEVLKQRKIAYT